jgi:S-adenosylhomocysteine hydrolase
MIQMMNRKVVQARHERLATERFCMERGERLHRIVAGNIIDFAHADGKPCIHTTEVKE